MTAFQVLGIAVAGSCAALIVVAMLTRRARPRTGLPWALVWLAAAVAIARPDLTVIVARSLGIARGADLVSYVAILSGLAGFFVVYLRLRHVEAVLTDVVRELALRGARRPDDETPAR